MTRFININGEQVQVFRRNGREYRELSQNERLRNRAKFNGLVATATRFRCNSCNEDLAVSEPSFVAGMNAYGKLRGSHSDCEISVVTASGALARLFRTDFTEV